MTVDAAIDPTTGAFSSGFPTAALGVGGSPYTIAYSFAGNPSFAPASTTTTLTVTQATPTVTWATPADITFGTALGSAQLDATASVPGSFAYTPAAGTLLSAGQGQALSATFTPTDATDYTTAPGSTTINVLTATPTFSMLSAPTITYGTATTTLSGQIAAGTLIPSGSVAITLGGVTENAAIDATTGDFSAPFTTSTLGVGGSPYTITYSFAGNTNFAPASTSTTLTVNQATPTVTWATPADITYGTALGAAQLDATASVPGTLHLHAGRRHRLAGGPGSGLVGDLHADRRDRLRHRIRLDDHQRADGDAHLQQAVRADDHLRHRHDHPFRADRRRHADSIRAGRDHPGRRDRRRRDRPDDRRFSAVFTTAALGVGASPYTISYSYAGDTNFAPASTTTTLTVNPATPTVTWAAPADITYGTALDRCSSTPRPRSRARSRTRRSPAPSCPRDRVRSLSATFTPTDTADYTTAPGATTINVLPVTPTFSMLSAPTITYGTATTTLFGQIAAGTLIPTGSVAITLSGVTMEAPIDATTGAFSSVFTTAALGVAGSPDTDLVQLRGKHELRRGQHQPPR